VLTRFQARADAAGLTIWDVSVDSTIARAHQHGVAARFDKLAVRYEATVQVAAINIWLRCLERAYETRPSRR
jgi:transposase